MHLPAMPTAKSDLSTHPCITIRWSVPPRCYLPVANGGGLVGSTVGGRVGGRVALDSAWAVRGSDVAC